MQILRIDNIDLSDEEVEYLINQVDTDKDGKISFKEFIKMLKLGENNGHFEEGTSSYLQEMHQDRNKKKEE